MVVYATPAMSGVVYTAAVYAMSDIAYTVAVYATPDIAYTAAVYPITSIILFNETTPEQLLSTPKCQLSTLIVIIPAKNVYRCTGYLLFNEVLGLCEVNEFRVGVDFHLNLSQWRCRSSCKL